MSEIRFPLQNRVGEVYEPFKTRFLTRSIEGLAPDEVLVKVRASAVCGSDLHIARGLHPSAPLPVTIGPGLRWSPASSAANAMPAATGSIPTAKIYPLPTGWGMGLWPIMSWSNRPMFTSCPRA